MIECLPGLQNALGPFPSTAPHKAMEAPVVPARRKWRQKDQKFKVLLSYKMSLRLAWATQDGVWLTEFTLTVAWMQCCLFVR